MARFFGCAMLLAVIPICATFSMDRLLMFVGIGAFGLLARFTQFAFSAERLARSGTPYRIVAKLGETNTRAGR